VVVAEPFAPGDLLDGAVQGGERKRFELRFLATGELCGDRPAPRRERPANVETGHIFAASLKDNEVGRAVCVDFLPGGLAAGAYGASPARG